MPKSLLTKRFGASKCSKPYVQNVLASPDTQNLTCKAFWSLQMPKTLCTQQFRPAEGPDLKKIYNYKKKSRMRRIRSLKFEDSSEGLLANLQTLLSPVARRIRRFASGLP